MCQPYRLTRGRSRFSHRRGCQPSRRGPQPTILLKSSQKLQEIEEILGHRVRTLGAPPLRSATANSLFLSWSFWKHLANMCNEVDFCIQGLAVVPFARPSVVWVLSMTSKTTSMLVLPTSTKCVRDNLSLIPIIHVTVIFLWGILHCCTLLPIMSTPLCLMIGASVHTSISSTSESSSFLH